MGAHPGGSITTKKVTNAEVNTPISPFSISARPRACR
jgi:hypothetical protein